MKLEECVEVEPLSLEFAGMPEIVGDKSFDYLVVGAGFAGAVLAERLASQNNKSVLIIDKRSHVGGNAYDHINSHGILIHEYGPHIFHTSSSAVVSYLSQFTEWYPYEHRVLANIDDALLPFPINLDTINQLYGLALDSEGMKHFISRKCEKKTLIRNSEDLLLSRVGRDLYEKFFYNYTRKQWGLSPVEIDSSVAARIPIRFDRDDRYFSDCFQAMPAAGFTKMFERMLAHPNITTLLETSYQALGTKYRSQKVIFTGPIDQYFSYRFGPLPYRSLDFDMQTYNVQRFQPSAVINYPNSYPFTRTSEFKYFTGQQHHKTTVCFEYPSAVGEPYYPIRRPSNDLIYEQYRTLAGTTPNVYFCGRLATYRYLNMDQVVSQALALFRRLTLNELGSA